MVLIVTLDHSGLESGQNVDITGPQTKDERSAHRVFVEIQAKLAHRPSGFLSIAVPNAPLPLLPGRCRPQSLPGSRDSKPRRRALGQDSNADIRGQFPLETCPSCTSLRIAVRS